MKAIYLLLLISVTVSCTQSSLKPKQASLPDSTETPPVQEKKKSPSKELPEPDTALYSRIMQHLVYDSATDRWPVKTGYPLPGAILPYKRVVAYYGNLYSRRMGILGEFSPDTMLEKLKAQAQQWADADSLIPVQPALHYIAVTAQSSPGSGGKYRLRMPDKEIDKVLEIAKKIDAIVFLDVQVGLGSLEEELPPLEKYLQLPNVHLGIDPEFSMKNGKRPGTTIGTFDAADINYATSLLTRLVKTHGLPPKILIVHRFTQGMVTNYKSIQLHPEVQLVMHMDGFGVPAKKMNSYKSWITQQPVEYTGLKLFYKNDVVVGGHLLTPAEVLTKFYPRPVYIQYQ